MTAHDMALHSEVDWPPRVPAGDVTGLNALYRRRGDIVFRFRGEPARLRLLPPDALVAPDGPTFRISLGGAPAVVRVTESFAAELLRPLALQRPFGEVEPEAAAILAEFALMDEIERAEAAVGWPVSVEARVSGPAGSPGQRLGLMLERPGREEPIALWLDRDGLTRLGAALDRAAKVPADWTSKILMPVRVCMGWRELTVAQLKGLERGDVVLVETGKEMAGPIAVAANGLATRLSVSGGRLLASSKPKPLRGSFWEWCMEGEGPQGERAVGDAEIDALPVKLIFELGRAEMPLGDLRRLEAGSVVPLARALDEAVDIVANGRRIGRGSIVRIGDAVGVRVERLTTDD